VLLVPIQRHDHGEQTPNTAPDAPTDGPGLASTLNADPANPPASRRAACASSERVLAPCRRLYSDHVADDVVEPAMQKHRGHHAPPFAREHLGLDQRAGVDQRRAPKARLDHLLRGHEDADAISQAKTAMFTAMIRTITGGMRRMPRSKSMRLSAA
jgi:hypothetical protein